jgi:hypothetical protein
MATFITTTVRTSNPKSSSKGRTYSAGNDVPWPLWTKVLIIVFTKAYNRILCWTSSISLSLSYFTPVIKLKFRGLSPRANYTDRAKLVPTFADRGCNVVSVTDPLRPYSRLSRQEPLLFLSRNSSVGLTRLSGPSSRPTASQKIW